MTDTTNQRAAALARLAWKPSGPDAALGQTVSREEEIERAERQLSGPLPLLIDRHRARRDAELTSAAEVLAGELRAGRDLDDSIAGEPLSRFKKAMDFAATHDDKVQRLERIAAEQRATLSIARVKREPRVYEPGSRSSYFSDLAFSTRNEPGALARLARYSRELSYEAAGRSEEGLRALKIAEARAREGGPGAVAAEQRAMTSGSSSGGSFVTPQYLVDDWAVWRSYAPSFLEQSVKVDDPGYGLTMYLPAFTSGPTIAAQLGENQGVVVSGPGASYLSAPLVTQVGEIDISMQLEDRAGPLDFDQVLYRQMGIQLATACDSYVLAQAIAGAGSIAGAATFTAANLYGDLAKARAAMATTDGTKLKATHLFLQDDVAEWMLAQVDPNGRPILLPAPSNVALPITPDRTGGPPPGYTGNRVLSTAVFTDGSIAATGSNAQLVVANMGEVFTQQSEPIARAFPETDATTMSVVVQLYCQVGVIVRHPAVAVQVIASNAYPAAPSFA